MQNLVIRNGLIVTAEQQFEADIRIRGDKIVEIGHHLPRREGDERELEAQLSRAGFSIYEGTEVTGWPRITIRRGQVVYEEGQITAQPGSGQLIQHRRTTDPKAGGGTSSTTPELRHFEYPE